MENEDADEEEEEEDEDEDEEDEEAEGGGGGGSGGADVEGKTDRDRTSRVDGSVQRHACPRVHRTGGEQHLIGAGAKQANDWRRRPIHGGCALPLCREQSRGRL